MPQKPSLRALRRWYRASVVFLLFIAVCVVMMYVDSPTDASTQIPIWLAYVATALNARSIRTTLRRRLAASERERERS